jgi:hypothetical protein
MLMTEPGFVHATRASYDTVAADYVTWFGGELAARPLDRALLAGSRSLFGQPVPLPSLTLDAVPDV